MAAPQLLIPIDSTWLAALASRAATKSDGAWKVEIDDDDDGIYADYTGYIDNNQIAVSGSASIFKPAEASSAQVIFRNSPKILSEGDLANMPIKISARIAGAAFILLFSGYIEAKGAARTKINLPQDYISITAYDMLKSRGVARSCASEALLNFQICNMVTPTASIAHHLASVIGLASGDIDFMSIPQTKDYLPLSVNDKVLKELQDLAAQHGAFLGVRYDGKLRLLVWTEAEWNAAVPEFTLDDTNVHLWKGSGGEVLCNRAVTEYIDYEVLPAGLVYKNYDAWDKDKKQNAIVIAAGKYWPGVDDDLAVGRLNYGMNGEAYPVGITIQAATVGGVGTGADIECEGGVLVIDSFNGSNANTRQNVDSAEIILHNNTGAAITIRKFEIRGTPLRAKAKNIVDYEDPAIADPTLEVKLDIPGKYACNVAQAKATVKRFVDYGRQGRKEFIVDEADWLPHIQCGAIVRFHPNADVDVDCVVTKYAHKSKGPISNARTALTLVERIDKSDTGTGGSVISLPGEGGGPILELQADVNDRPVFDEIFSGFVSAGGTTVPTVPVIQIAQGVYHGILLLWDRQVNLSNFSHYAIQVSDDNATWYDLRFDEVDWKGTLNSATIVKSSLLIHTGLGTQTLYYKVRRVTGAGDMSAFSASISATSSDVASAQNAFDDLYVNRLVVGNLRAMFASISGELAIGASYDLNVAPVTGDQKIIIDGNELSLKEYQGGAWVDITKLGGNDQMKWYLQARGLIKTGTDVSTVLIGAVAPIAAKIFSLDYIYTDQNGANPWTVVNGEFVIGGRFGARAWRSTAGNVGTLTDADAGGISFGSSFSVDLWADITAFADEDILKLEATDLPGVAALYNDAGANFTTVPIGETPAIANNLCQLDETHAVVVWGGGGATTYLKARVILRNADGTSDSYGTEKTLDSFTINGSAITVGRVCRISDTQFAVIVEWDNDNAFTTRYYRIYKCSISGTTVNNVDASITKSNTWRDIGDPFGVIGRMDANTLCFAITNLDTGDLNAGIIDVSTWAILGEQIIDTRGIVSISELSNAIDIVGLSSTKAIVMTQVKTGATYYISLIGIDWTSSTLTFGSPLNIVTTTTAFTPPGHVKYVDGTHALVMYSNDQVNVRLAIATIAGTTITLGSVLSLTDNPRTLGGIEYLLTKDGLPIYECVYTRYGAATRDIVAVWISINGTTLTQVGSAKNIVAGVSTAGTAPGLWLASSAGRSCIFHTIIYGKYGLSPVLNHCSVYSKLKISNLASGNSFVFLFENWGLAPAIESAAITTAGAGWYHISVNYDYATKQIGATVNSAAITPLAESGKTLALGTHSLVIYSNSQHQSFSDLLILYGSLLTTAQSITHFTDFQPWVDAATGIDFNLDLFLMTKPDGKIKMLSPTFFGVAPFYAPLPQTAAGVGQVQWIVGGAGLGLALPAGGTWEWELKLWNTTSGVVQYTGGAEAGIGAGGTNIWAGGAPYTAGAKVWRIA